VEIPSRTRGARIAARLEWKLPMMAAAWRISGVAKDARDGWGFPAPQTPATGNVLCPPRTGMAGGTGLGHLPRPIKRGSPAWTAC
jgi:hypothetical protein